MAEKKKAGVRVEPPEQREQVAETVQAPMTEATVAPEPRYSLQARVDRLAGGQAGREVAGNPEHEFAGRVRGAWHQDLRE